MWTWATATAAEPLVPVAAREIPAGAVLTEEDLYAIRRSSPWWPVVPGPTVEEVLGRTAILRILPDEVVTAERVGLSSPWSPPDPGRVGWVVASDLPFLAGASVDVVRSTQDGCVVERGARVLRAGEGVQLVQLSADSVSMAVGGGLEAVVAGAAGRPCRGPAPPVAHDPAPPRPIPDDGVAVPVAARDLRPGQTIGPEDLARVVLPRDLVSAAAVTYELEGREVREPSFRGELFRRERVGPPTAEPPDLAPPAAGSVLETAAGAPWWPGEEVGVLHPSGCLLGRAVVWGSPGRASAAGPPLSDVAFSVLGYSGLVVDGSQVAVSGTWSAAAIPVLASAEPGRIPTCPARLVPAPPAPAPAPSWRTRILVRDDGGRARSDVVVRYGRANGAWDGELRPGSDGSVRVPRVDGRQLWIRVEVPGSDPTTFGQRTFDGRSEVRLGSPPSGRCTPHPKEARSEDGVFDALGGPPPEAPRWIRLVVSGDLVHRDVRLLFEEQPDGGAEVTVDGEGLGAGGDLHRVRLARDPWSALVDRVSAAVTALPTLDDAPLPAHACVVASTWWQVELGDLGGRDGLRRWTFAPASPEETLFADVLAAAGLDIHR